MFINIWRGQYTYIATPGASKKKWRQCSVEYLKYGFIQSPTNPQQPMCLVCEKNFFNEAMKPSRLLEHLQKIHPDKSGKTLAFFHSLQDQFLKQKTMNMFTSSSKKFRWRSEGFLQHFFADSKSGQAGTIGEELILLAVKEVIKTVLHKSPEQVIKSIPLSDNSVRRRVDKIAENVEETLSKMLMTTEFSLQLDESTLPGNESLLLAYIRFIKGGSLCQELLFAHLLETDTKGESVYRAVEDYFQKKSIPLTNIISCATDGTLSMVGRHRGFLSYLKKKLFRSPHSSLCDPSTTLSDKEFEWEAIWILIDCDYCSQQNQSKCSQFSTVPSAEYWKWRRFSMPASPYRS